MSDAAPLRRRSSLRGSTSLPTLPANRRNSAPQTEAPPTASTAAIASAAATLDSWLGLYFVPSFMEMLKKAKKSGGLSFN